MKKNAFKLFLITLIFSIVLLGVGCNTIKKASKATTANKTKETTVVIKSKDSKESISVPSSWKENNTLNDLALIQVANLAQEKYLIIIGEGKDSFSKDMKLSDYTKLVKDGMMKNVKNSKATDTKDMTVDGNQCQYYEVSGEMEKIMVTYMIRTVSSTNKYYQVIAWTMTPKYDANKAEIKQVMDSFKIAK